MWNLKSIRSFDSFKNQRLTPHKALLSLTGSIHGPSSTSYLILRDMKRHSVSLSYGNFKNFTTLFPGFSASRPTELRRAGRREPRERGWNFYCSLYSSTVREFLALQLQRKQIHTVISGVKLNYRCNFKFVLFCWTKTTVRDETQHSAWGSLNFIRLLRVVITPSVTSESTCRYDAVQWRQFPLIEKKLFGP